MLISHCLYAIKQFHLQYHILIIIFRFLFFNQGSSIKLLSASSGLFFSNANYLVYWISIFVIHYLSSSLSSPLCNSFPIQLMRTSQTFLHPSFSALSVLYCFSGGFMTLHFSVLFYISLTVLGPFSFLFFSYFIT